MFFFLGGVWQEVTEILQREVGQCLRCGHPADSVHYNNVLELFLVPVWRWRGQQPALHCTNCGFLMPAGHFETLPEKPHPTPPEAAAVGGHSCWSCSRLLDLSFKFCPECGSRQQF